MHPPICYSYLRAINYIDILKLFIPMKDTLIIANKKNHFIVNNSGRAYSKSDIANSFNVQNICYFIHYILEIYTIKCD